MLGGSFRLVGLSHTASEEWSACHTPSTQHIGVGGIGNINYVHALIASAQGVGCSRSLGSPVTEEHLHFYLVPRALFIYYRVDISFSYAYYAVRKFRTAVFCAVVLLFGFRGFFFSLRLEENCNKLKLFGKSVHCCLLYFLKTFHFIVLWVSSTSIQLQLVN